MSRKAKRHSKRDERSTGATTAPEAEERQLDGASGPADAPPPSTEAGVPVQEEDELSTLRREVEELREKQLRQLAETQNMQKRAQREQQEALRFAEFEFARELLVVLDDLERTLESAKIASDAQSLADGVRIIYEHFLKVLHDHGIKPIEAAGRPFDPAFHEALLQQPSDEHEAGTVIQEVARGYTMHERVLRSSRVIVSS